MTDTQVLPQMSDPVWSEDDRQRASELLLKNDIPRFRREMLPRLEAALKRQAAAQGKAA